MVLQTFYDCHLIASESRTATSPPILIERDVRVPMDDGVVLRADVFRPDGTTPVPVIMTLGPYGKGVRYQDGYAFAQRWRTLHTAHPQILDGSTGSYLVWETVDPERWVPHGYAVVRVDSRGAGRSPGVMDLFSPREVRDFYLAIEWAGARPWSNGKVGLCGISYFAINQWQVAALNPPHLSAIIPWEGASDHYRDMARHGGILSNRFWEIWYPRQVTPVQHGRGVHGPVDPWLREPAAGPETLTEAELEAHRADFIGNLRRHELDDRFHRSRSPDLEKITVPLLSAGNWGGLGLHARGNFEGFSRASSEQKWLDVHVGHHEEWFYLDYGRELQRRFFDFFLKGEDNGWDCEPRVRLNIRAANGSTTLRAEEEWPLARTRWTKLHLDAQSMRVTSSPPRRPATLQFEAQGEPVTLRSDSLQSSVELTGPVAARIIVSSTTADADVFLTLRAFGPDGREIDFAGANDPHAPLSQGWLRASHRELDKVRSLPYRPYHSHRRRRRLRPARRYRLDVELWPTSVVLPAGSQMALTIGGRDFERTETDASLGGFRGSGAFLHDDPYDRPPELFGGVTTIHTGTRESFILLPVIPSAESPGLRID